MGKERKTGTTVDAAPEVSIIVPIYNAARFCKRCFGSILAQDFRDFEVVAVDDCSTDGGAELLERSWPKDAPPLRILRNERNMGPGGARNRGLEVARGKYIGFIDSDDSVRPGYIRTLYETAERTQAGYVSCGSVLAYEDGTMAPHMCSNFVAEGRREILERLESFEFNLTTWGSLVRSSIVEKYHVRFNNGPFEDIFFHFRVLFHSPRAVVVNDMLYDYHVRKASISHEMAREDFSYIEIFCTLLPMVADFLSKSEASGGEALAQEDEEKIYNFFLRLMVHQLKMTAAKIGTAAFRAQLAGCLEQHFGKVPSFYIRTLVEFVLDVWSLEQENALRKKIQALSAQLNLCETMVPELVTFSKKRRMSVALLNAAQHPLQILLQQEWYHEYWNLVAEDVHAPGMQEELLRMKKDVVAWIEKHSGTARQFGALGLLLIAPISEVRPYIDTSLWPEALRRDYEALEARGR